jgi:beta-glucosidase
MKRTRLTYFVVSCSLWCFLLLLGACSNAASPTQRPAPTAPAAPVESIDQRVADLLAQMTLAEKIGQMTQVEKDSIAPADVTRYFIGSVLSGGGGSPANNTPADWLAMVSSYQQAALETRLGIPLLYGVDAVHGHAAVVGATVFPHNIGLGAADDPELMRRIGQVTAAELAATGIRWNFAPVVAVPQDVRWGRTYESFGEDPALVSRLAVPYLQGLQNDASGQRFGDLAAVLATPKHFLADGGTAFGSSTTEIIVPYLLDQGDAAIDDATLRAVHLPPYQAAIDAGAASVMASFSSVNGVKMHANRDLLTGLLRGELGFQGFVVSDWQGIDQIPGDYDSDVATAINAGIDMVMVPYDYKLFIDTLTQAVQRGDVTEARIDEAVNRILRVKFEMGLFDGDPMQPGAPLEVVGSAQHRELARQAVRQSLVLLKNEGRTLPLLDDTPLIYVSGQGADDIGIQVGGWATQWQGEAGAITDGATIVQGLQQVSQPGSNVLFDAAGRFDSFSDAAGQPLIADVGVAVVAERPYAEGVGDSSDLALPPADLAAAQRLRENVRRLVLVVVAGRPVDITKLLPLADAVVVAWLPGSEGAGVADALFGHAPFSGKLPVAWPRSVEQLPREASAQTPQHDTDGADPLFPAGFGLTTEPRADNASGAAAPAIPAGNASASASQSEATPTTKGSLPMNPIIPLPASMRATGDSFAVTDDTQIIVDSGSAELAAIAAELAQWLGVSVLATDEAQPTGAIRLTLADADPTLGDEGYELSVTPDGVTIRASQPAGLFYGVQTLRQSLPAEMGSAAAQSGPWSIPTVVIRDAPRYPWRGIMLDVVRHFRTVDDLKRVVDLMALYKMNRLHLHLTDDQGWRLMIESWPRLAEYGGSTAVGDDPGGYYTQAEYADLVAYAASRYVEIVPEIDLPGHTNAALASYAELNCDGVARAPYTGIEVGFSSLCIDKELTYQFLDDVIGELAALTPGAFIHIGGDEAHSTPEADYRRFFERVQQIVQRHGKQVVGWAEIAQVELLPGSAAQYWQGDHGGRAASQGAAVIMSPASYAYLDMKYDDSSPVGLSWAGNISVQRAYDWDPATVQPDIPEAAILGVEAPLWAETVRTMDDLEYLVFPRLLGYAEIGWTPAAARSWEEYRQRLAGHVARLDALGVNFYRGWMD